MPTPRPVTALLYVQHLLGIGHLVRAGALARGLEAAGIRVVLVSGGMPVPVLDIGVGVSRFEQLPPVRAADETFKNLVDETGNSVDDAWRARRRERLLAIFHRERPDIVITELYPFGRRQMRFEIEPLLERARTLREQAGLPVIASSVRDILVPPAKAERTDEIIERVRHYYDLVLTHGDGEVIPFERSFTRAGDIAGITRSTGYVVGPVPARQGPGAPGYDEVIVSAGGGAVSEDLLQAAIGARALCDLRERVWRVLIGHNYAEAAFLTCRAAAPTGVLVERARSDFTQLLANCALSISQGGYNTVTEILATGARAVCLPFAGGRESEQTLRCRLLAERGVLQVVERDVLCAEQVALAVGRALKSQPDQGHMVNMDGAARSAALLLEAVQGKK
ncbi:MAG: glycosyltransferase [Gammaproteobacteria bacterium]